MLVYTELTSIFSYIDVRSKIVKYAGTFINLNNKEKLLLNDRTRDRDTLENKCSSIILLSILLKHPMYFSKLIFYDKSQLIFNESQFLWFMTSVSCVFMETFHTTTSISFAFFNCLSRRKTEYNGNTTTPKLFRYIKWVVCCGWNVRRTAKKPHEADRVQSLE